MANPDKNPGGGATAADAGENFQQTYEGTTTVTKYIEGKGVVDQEVPVKAFEGKILGINIAVVSGDLPSGAEGAAGAEDLTARHIAARLELGGGRVVAEVKKGDIQK